MRFGIVVPVYNAEKYLKKCLDSIYGQDFKDYEVLLIDDGSTDNSAAICDEYARRYPNTQVVHKTNRGLISARREGYKLASAEYILNCDADDLIENNTLSFLNDIIVKAKPDVIIYNAFACFEDRKEPFFEHIFDNGFIEDKTELFNKLLLTYQINSLCMKTYKRDIIDLECDYSEFYDCNYGEDLLQTVPLLIKANRIYYTDTSLYDYRMNSGMTTSYNNEQYWSYKKIFNRIAEQLKDQDIPGFKEKCSVYIVSAGYEAVRLNRYDDRFHEEDVIAIARDDDFKRAYECLRETENLGRFTLKQRMILNLLYNNSIGPVKMLFMIRYNLWNNRR